MPHKLKRSPKFYRCGIEVEQTPLLKLTSSSLDLNIQTIDYRPRSFLFNHYGIIQADFVSPPPNLYPLWDNTISLRVHLHQHDESNFRESILMLYMVTRIKSRVFFWKQVNFQYRVRNKSKSTCPNAGSSTSPPQARKKIM